MEKAPIVPMSIYGAKTAWEDLLRGVRPTVKINIGKPFGPFDISGSREEKTKQIEEVNGNITGALL